MSADPGTENNTQVYIDGVYQFKNTYTVSGTTLTFDTAPANGASIEIIAITAGSVNVPTDDSVSTAKIQNNAVTADKIVANAVGISELNVSDGSNGQALVTNGSGTLSFATISSTPTSIADADADTKVQVEEGSDDDTIRFDTAGTERHRVSSTGKASWSAGGIGNVATQDRDFTFYTEGSTNGVAINSNDHRIVFMGGAASSGAGMDTGYFQLENAGTANVFFNANGESQVGGGLLRVQSAHADGGGRIRLKSTDASDADAELYGSVEAENNSGTVLARIRFLSEGSGNDQSHIEFDTNGGSGLTNYMRIRSNGTVQITTLSKGSGTFEIPHPLESKKDTHKLRHSFIEGPQCDNIYRGKVTLSSGTATVNLDTVSGMTNGTFVALNRDIQVFTTNESDWNPVKGSVSGNVLTITCQDNQSTDTVSWMVIGERQDDTIKESTLTDANGYLVVEPENYENDT